MATYKCLLCDSESPCELSAEDADFRPTLCPFSTTNAAWKTDEEIDAMLGPEEEAND